MKKEVLKQIEEVEQNFDLGFVNGFDALCNLNDVLTSFGNDMNDEQRDVWQKIIFDTFAANEKINDGFRDLADQWKIIFSV